MVNLDALGGTDCYHGNNGQQVVLIVNVDTLVSRCHGLLPWKQIDQHWSGGVTNSYHGNTLVAGVTDFKCGGWKATF